MENETSSAGCTSIFYHFITFSNTPFNIWLHSFLIPAESIELYDSKSLIYLIVMAYTYREYTDSINNNNTHSVLYDIT